MDITMKDFRNFRFKFPNYNKVDKIVSKLTEYSNIISPSKSPAYILFEEYFEIEQKFRGWEIYDVIKEFIRQGINIENDHNIRKIDNKKGEVCLTYPSQLLIPKIVTTDVLDKCIKFRSKNRFPVLTYLYAKNNKKVYLWRSAQCASGFTSRSSEDETYLKILGDLKGFSSSECKYILYKSPHP